MVKSEIKVEHDTINRAQSHRLFSDYLPLITSTFSEITT